MSSSTSSTAYHFVTRWRVQGTAAEVYEIIDAAAELPRWWPAVYLDVKQVAPGDEKGLGKVYDLHTKGWLPYTLRWQMTIVEKKPPSRLVLEARGDFAGRGVWTITGDAPWVDVTFDWQVEVTKPLLRRFSFLIKPVFAANHRWAMAVGEKSLELELARRHAPTPQDWASVPPPPGPTTTSVVPLLVVGVGAGLVVLAVLLKLVLVVLGG
jgi:hypothetical protein